MVGRGYCRQSAERPSGLRAGLLGFNSVSFEMGRGRGWTGRGGPLHTETATANGNKKTTLNPTEMLYMPQEIALHGNVILNSLQLFKQIPLLIH